MCMYALHHNLLMARFNTKWDFISPPSQSLTVGSMDPQSILSHSKLNPHSIPNYFGSNILMDEEMSQIEMGELNLLGLDYSYTKKYFSSIPSYQIQLLKEALRKAKVQNKLGVINIQQKDKQRLMWESKK